MRIALIRKLESMVAGYQKAMEGDFLGLANATQQTLDYLNYYGEDGLHIDSHISGGMTTGNAVTSFNNQPNSAGGLSGTSLDLYGAAYNAEELDEQLSEAQGYSSPTDANRPSDNVVKQSTHKSDFVSTFLGGNPSTGGSNRPGVSTIREYLHMFGGSETTHNCYGNARAECDPYVNTPIRLEAANEK